ncbi:hypothetical protein JCM18899A_04770 [Nocardioides sp. AN3]
MLVGWALWHAILDQPGATPHPSSTPTPSLPRGGESGYVAHEPPAVPYLRSGTLVPPDGEPRGIPDGSWTGFSLLADGRVVLVQDGSVVVLGPGTQRHGYPAVGDLSARPDGTAVAWTGGDGHLLRLRTGRAEPERVVGARQLRPACRGIRVDGTASAGWATCDRDGHLLSPDGTYFASIGSVSVTLAPRADITAGASVAFLGSIVDAAWEDPYHLLVVIGIADELHLERIGVGGESEDLLVLHGINDRRSPPLVLPVTAGPSGTTITMQP